MNNDLIVLEQLPIIKYQLEQLSGQIKERVEKVEGLVVNEENVKETKKLRTELRKEFENFENARKAVHDAIDAKYKEFEAVYKEKVSNLYTDADAQLKAKIDEVEYELKIKRENELREFFTQYQKNYHLEGILDFENINLKIIASESDKKLKEQIAKYCEKIYNDIQIIASEENSEELLLEYKNNGFDYQKAKLVLIERKRQLEELKQKQEKVEQQIVQEVKAEEKVAEIIAPKEIIEEDEELEVTFTLKGSKNKILQVKKLIEELGIEYE